MEPSLLEKIADVGIISGIIVIPSVAGAFVLDYVVGRAEEHREQLQRLLNPFVISEKYRIKSAIRNSRPPFEDGQLYFPFMADYVDDIMKERGLMSTNRKAPTQQP